jgi:glycine/D-amino acid oxidase-like deaminating enzyme
LTVPERAEIVIVGAGIVGAFVALHLARLGHEVLVLDRKEAGFEASGLNAGSLAVQNKPLDLARLALEGTRQWERFDRSTQRTSSYHRTGGLRVAHDDAGVERLRRACDDQRALGLEIEHIDGDEARRRCPALGPSVVAANWSPYDGHNDALTATAAVVAEAQEAGARIAFRVDVARIEPDGTGVSLMLGDSSRLRAEAVVVAAGLWTKRLCEPLGVDVPLRVRNNQMMVTARVPRMLDLLITHASGRLTLKQVDAGSVLIGGGWPGDGDVAANRKGPNLASMIGNARIAATVVPSLARTAVIRSWAGFDGRTPDELPLVGPVPSAPSVWLCTSCYGTYTLGPALAAHLAEWIHGGDRPTALAGFAPGERVVASAPRFVGPR